MTAAKRHFHIFGIRSLAKMRVVHEFLLAEMRTHFNEEFTRSLGNPEELRIAESYETLFDYLNSITCFASIKISLLIYH